MPFKFNPLTGNLDLVGSGGSSSGSDNQSGFYEIVSSEIATIEQYKQMVCFGDLIIDGELRIDGMLVMEG